MPCEYHHYPMTHIYDYLGFTWDERARVCSSGCIGSCTARRPKLPKGPTRCRAVSSRTGRPIRPPPSKQAKPRSSGTSSAGVASTASSSKRAVKRPAPPAGSAKKQKGSTPAPQNGAQLVAARLPGAPDPPWLCSKFGYPRDRQYLLRHFGWPVKRKRDGAVGIVKAVNGDSVTLEWGQKAESQADAARAGPRAAHPVVSSIATEEDKFENAVRKGTLVLLQPEQEEGNTSAPTCGPPCPGCGADLGVGAEAWTRCWSCGAPEPGAHAGTNARKHKDSIYEWAPSTLSGAQASDGSSDGSSDESDSE